VVALDIDLRRTADAGFKMKEASFEAHHYKDIVSSVQEAK
jgi:hypothetical protein